MEIVRSFCPLTGVPIFMGLISMAEHQARKERRLERDAALARAAHGPFREMGVSPECFKSLNRRRPGI